MSYMEPHDQDLQHRERDKARQAFFDWLVTEYEARVLILQPSDVLFITVDADMAEGVYEELADMMRNLRTDLGIADVYILPGTSSAFRVPLTALEQGKRRKLRRPQPSPVEEEPDDSEPKLPGHYAIRKNTNCMLATGCLTSGSSGCGIWCEEHLAEVARTAHRWL